MERGAQELKAALAENARLYVEAIAKSTRIMQEEMRLAEDRHRERCQAAREARIAKGQEAQRAAAERGEALTAQSDRLKDIDREMASLLERAEAYRTDYHVRQMAASSREHAVQLGRRAAHLTQAISSLRDYGACLAERLPIHGLAVSISEDGKNTVTIDGVPRAQVNKARLAEIAVEVALLRAKPRTKAPYLPLVLLDDAEKLDQRARRALFKEIASRGSQVIAAVVGEGTLKALTAWKPPLSAIIVCVLCRKSSSRVMREELFLFLAGYRRLLA